MKRPTKKSLYEYISKKHDIKYKDPQGFDEFKSALSILKIGNQDEIDDLHMLINMDKEKRLIFRYRLATNGRELTPSQVDIHISIIEYALKYVNENT
tara:strand:- start:421 stop:711 length:291 start_codon:yes stop_codon:yes gene_type:complete